MLDFADRWLLLFGIIVNLPVGYFAFKKKSLTFPGGFFAAAIIGFTLFIVHPIQWLILLIFFSSSSVLSKYNSENSFKQEAMKFAEKGGNRDIIQVFANGGVAFIVGVSVLLLSGLLYQQLDTALMVVIVSSFAAANADTWGTEIGTTSKTDPVWILNPRKRVPRGTSGGVSVKGTIASFLGSLVVAVSYFIFITINNWGFEFKFIRLGIVITLIGVLGSLIDTLLGATLQAKFECLSCLKTTEKRYHVHGEKVETKHIGGLKFFSNDVVNFVSIGLASLSIFIFF